MQFIYICKTALHVSGGIRKRLCKHDRANRRVFCHSFMNCGLRHFGNDVMQLSYRQASICANFSFNFVKKFVRDQRRPTTPLFVVNISSSFGEFTAQLRHILQIHNVARNSNSLFVNFCWTFTFCVEKSYDGMHRAFGGTLDRRCHFKHVSLKHRRFYHCQTRKAHV